MGVIKNNLARIILSIFIVIFCLPFEINASSQPAQPNSNYSKNGIETYIKSVMKQKNIPGLSIVIVDDTSVWKQSFGYADLKQKTPFTENSIVRVRNITGLYTAIAIMQLAEQGKIDLDKPIQTYIPEFSIKSRFPDSAPITTRSILSQHSGLPATWLKGYFDEDSAYFSSLVNEIKDEYMAFPPNTVYSYSAIGNCLLGVIIENVSGQKYADYMQEHIFLPMQMNHSAFTAFPEIIPSISPAYSQGKPIYEKELRDTPDIGMYSSAEDLSHLIQIALSGGKYQDQNIIHTETLNEMFRTQTRNTPLDLDDEFGLGWYINSDPRIRELGKTYMRAGGWFYNSIIIFIPDHHLGLVITMNTGTDDILEIPDHVAKLAVEAKTGFKLETKKEVSPPVTKLTSEQLNQYEGDYTTNRGVISIKRSGQNLTTSLWGTKIQMTPLADGWFSVEPRLFGIIPIHLDDVDFKLKVDTISGCRLLVLSVYGKRMILGEAVQPTPNIDTWSKKLGTYDISNDVNSSCRKAELKKTSDFLTLELYGEDNHPLWSWTLKPINDSETIIQGMGYWSNFGLGAGVQETVHWMKEGDKKEAFSFAGWKFVKK